MRRYLVGFVILLVATVALPTAAGAASLKISPLKYDVTLAAKEKKKGFVDITNPEGIEETVRLSVQAFRQTDDNGSLEFYDNDAITKGLLLDYSEITIGPHETVHLAFLADGTVLPSGDVFAAIFAATVPRSGAAVQSVRVGALLMMQNGTPAPHEAAIEELSVPAFQYQDKVTLDFLVHNTTNTTAVSGFSPSVTVDMWPYTSESVTGPLIFAGKTREITYTKQGNYLGFVRITVKTGNSTKVGYSFVVTGYWRWLFLLLIALGLSAVAWRVAKRRKRA